jgi:hypothetical protein
VAKRISDLPAATTINSTDVMPVDVGSPPLTKKVTLAQIFAGAFGNVSLPLPVNSLLKTTPDGMGFGSATSITEDLSGNVTIHKATLDASSLNVYSPDTGAVNTYVITTSINAVALVTGLSVQFVTANANTGAATLKINALTAKSIVFPGGAALQAGAIPAGVVCCVVYNGTAFELQSTTSAEANGTLQWLTSVAGTDTITAGNAGAVAAYRAGQQFTFIPAGVNTGSSPTLNVNSLGDKTIVLPGGGTVTAGALAAGTVVSVIYNGTAFELQNTGSGGGGGGPSGFTVVTSIAGLKALSKLTYSQAYVAGYYAAGDGGGGMYYYDAADTTTLASPTISGVTNSGSGGTLAAATYSYRVTALNAVGETLASSASTTTTSGTTSTATINWGAVTGATAYRVYGRTVGAEGFLAEVGAVTSFTDTGFLSPLTVVPVAASTPDNGGSVVVASDGGRWKLAGSGPFTTRQFGAKHDGATDDYAALQAAITYCQNSYSLRISSGTAYTTKTLIATQRTHLFGELAWLSVIKSNATYGLVLQPRYGAGITFPYMHDFSVIPNTNGAGTSGILFRLIPDNSGAVPNYVSNFTIARCYIGDFGSYGLNLDNSAVNGNGFFTFTIERNWISNGIVANHIGDSCNIHLNTITDGGTVAANRTGGRVGILYTGLSGARNCVFRENSITTSGGAIAALNGDQLRIENNQCEHPFYYSIPYGASGIYNALIYIYNCAYAKISGNTMQAGQGVVLATTTATTTSGSSTLTSVASFTNLYVGATIAGTGIPTSARIGSVNPGAGTITMVLPGGAAANATSSGAGRTMTFGLAPDYTVLFDGTSACRFNFLENGNDVFPGNVCHLGFTSGVVMNGLTGMNTFVGGSHGSLFPTVYDGGGGAYPQVGIWQALALNTGYSPFTYPSGSPADALYFVGVDGYCTLSGCVYNTTASAITLIASFLYLRSLTSPSGNTRYRFCTSASDSANVNIIQARGSSIEAVTTVGLGIQVCLDGVRFPYELSI